MKKSVRSSLSLLLVIAMIFSLGISAFATTGDDAFISSETLKIKVDDNSTGYETQTIAKCKGDTIKLTPNTSNNTSLEWEIDNADVNATLSFSKDKIEIKKTATGPVDLYCINSGSATIKIKDQDTSVTVNVTPKIIDSVKISYENAAATAESLDGKTIYGRVGETINLVATAKYSNGTATPNDPTNKIINSSTQWDLPSTVYSYSRDNGNLSVTLTNENTSGTVFTVKHTDVNASPQDKTASVTIKTTPVTSVIIKDSDGLTAKTVSYNNEVLLTYNTNIDSATKKPVTPTNSTVEWKSSDEKIATVEARESNTANIITQKKSGTAYITAIVDGVVSSKYSVTVTENCKEFTDNAVIGTNLNFNGLYSKISAMYTNNTGKTLSANDEITIKTITLKDSKNTVLGKLCQATGSEVTAKSYPLSEFKNFYFTPSAVGECKITFSISNQNSKAKEDTAKTMDDCSIVIDITSPAINPEAKVVAGSESFGMNSTNEYTSSSIQSQLQSKLTNISYVKFATSTATGKETGTLSAKDGTAYYMASTGIFDTNPLLSSVTFTPSSVAGTYTMKYTAYSTTGELASGKIIINVVNKEAPAVSIYYNVKTSGSVTLNEEDFSTWFLNNATNASSLTSVKFATPSINGKLKSSTGLWASFDSSATYYTKANAGSNKTIGDITYTAPSSVGYDYVSYTCTGLNKSGQTITLSGNLYFFAVKGDVSKITYNTQTSSSVNAVEKDFTDVYATAESDKTASPKLQIQFITLPSKGTLYKSNTSAVSTSDLFTTNDSTGTSISKVSYTPGTNATGSDTAVYVVYNSSSKLLYAGVVDFTTKSNNITFKTGAEGYTFKVSDFTKSSDSDPIVSVKFAIPTGGKLYTDYSYGSGIELTSANNKAFSTATNETISKVTFIPKAKDPADVTFGYVATTKANKTISGNITMDYTERTSTLKFNDVTTSWAIPAVDFCSSWGIATGTGTGTFSPNGTMQRGMLVTMLYRVAGQPSVSGLANPFKDVPTTQYYYNAVIWAYYNGIVNGTSTTTFSPSNPVSRQDIAAILYRFAKINGFGYNSTATYNDASNIAPYAKEAMNWAVYNEIITGSGGYLTPTASATRAQVATMLHRYLAK